MKKSVCIVVANFYPKISKTLIAGSIKILKSKGIKNYKIIKVPGVLEIPYVIKKNIKNYDGFIALGCVIRGETPHFDFISKASLNAIITLSVSYTKPIGNGIITCFNKKQALVRSGNNNNKGKESAKAVISLLKV